MRNITLLGVLGTALLLIGCGDLVSLHPLYTSQDRAFDTTLEGRWESGDDLLSVVRAGDAYEVTLQSQKNPVEQSKSKHVSWTSEVFVLRISFLWTPSATCSSRCA
jgi:hypothetical protein